MSKSGESVEYIVQEQGDDSLVWSSRFLFCWLSGHFKVKIF